MSGPVIHIYGLFTGDKCRYVGRSQNLVQRRVAHASKTMRGLDFELRILRTVPLDNGGITERDMIAHYRALGQADRNFRKKGVTKGVRESKRATKAMRRAMKAARIPLASRFITAAVQYAADEILAGRVIVVNGDFYPATEEAFK